jgi:hypothetical protein
MSKSLLGYAQEKITIIKKTLDEKIKSVDHVTAQVVFEETDGVIVLLDALGVKGIWNRKDPKEVLKTWTAIQTEFDNASRHLQSALQSAGHFEKLRFEAFSDTIMISLPVKDRGVGADLGRNPLWWTIMSIGEMLTSSSE